MPGFALPALSLVGIGFGFTGVASGLPATLGIARGLPTLTGTLAPFIAPVVSR